MKIKSIKKQIIILELFATLLMPLNNVLAMENTPQKMYDFHVKVKKTLMKTEKLVEIMREDLSTDMLRQRIESLQKEWKDLDLSNNISITDEIEDSLVLNILTGEMFSLFENCSDDKKDLLEPLINELGDMQKNTILDQFNDCPVI